MSMNFSVEKAALIKNVILSNSTLKLTIFKAQIQITKNVICKLTFIVNAHEIYMKTITIRLRSTHISL